MHLSALLWVKANHLPSFLSLLLPPQIKDRVSNVIYRNIHFRYSCYQSFVHMCVQSLCLVFIIIWPLLHTLVSYLTIEENQFLRKQSIAIFVIPV